jgi:hypothetical protein
MFASFHLALYEGSVTVREGKSVELKWLTVGVSAAVALAAAAEETWIKTNLLWNLVGVVLGCGWLIMNKEERRRLVLWIAGVALGRVVWEVWVQLIWASVTTEWKPTLP